MKELLTRIDDVLTALYDYEYIDIEKFYNDKNNQELLDIFETANYRGLPTEEEMESINELYQELDNFIKFETNYNSQIGDF